jgi:hypothetical protein
MRRITYRFVETRCSQFALEPVVVPWQHEGDGGRLKFDWSSCRPQARTIHVHRTPNELPELLSVGDVITCAAAGGESCNAATVLQAWRTRQETCAAFLQKRQRNLEILKGRRRAPITIPLGGIVRVFGDGTLALLVWCHSHRLLRAPGATVPPLLFGLVVGLWYRRRIESRRCARAVFLGLERTQRATKQQAMSTCDALPPSTRGARRRGRSVLVSYTSCSCVSAPLRLQA